VSVCIRTAHTHGEAKVKVVEQLARGGGALASDRGEHAQGASLAVGPVLPQGAVQRAEAMPRYVAAECDPRTSPRRRARRAHQALQDLEQEQIVPRRQLHKTQRTASVSTCQSPSPF
jgi:hypothetical protein